MTRAASILEHLDLFSLPGLGVGPCVTSPGTLVLDDVDQRFHYFAELGPVGARLLSVIK